MIAGIHYMRGIAALMVVLFHAISFLVIYRGYDSPIAHHVLATGVDIFFVISGFLMVRTTRRFDGGRLDWRQFLKKRLVRIAPLYWALTLALAALLLFKPDLAERQIDLSFLLKSLTFLPTEVPGSDVQSTIIPVGWTLVYEMFFYVVFAFATALSYRAGLIGVAAFFVLIASLHGYFSNYYLSLYSNPIILEFVFGMAIAWLRAPSLRMGWVFVAVGFVALVAGAYVAGEKLEYRPFAVGIGAALIIYGASGISVERALIGLTVLGDMSYSLYLTHGYVIKLGSKFVSPSAASVGVLTVASIVGAYIVYRLVELPVQNFLSSKSNSAPGLAAERA